MTDWTSGRTPGPAVASPFGAALNPTIFAIGQRHRKAQARLQASGQHDAGPDAGSNQTGKADKWALLRALAVARDTYGLSDRAVAVLEALVSCHPGREIDGATPQIVHPSNRELCMRTGGMAEATLRRHVASLVAAGLVVRRDSPNGKRYAVRDDRGAKADAYGFDLSPFALSAPDIHAAAEAREAADRALRRAREEISVLARDCAKIITAGLTEAPGALWEGFAAAFAGIGLRLPRSRDMAPLEARRASLCDLKDRVEAAYLAHLDAQEKRANDAHFERHQQNSNTYDQFEISRETKKKPDDRCAPEAKSQPEGGAPDEAGGAARRAAGPAANAPGSVTLGRFVAACPDFTEYARNGIRDWAEAAQIAVLVRSMLGVSPDAWRQAVGALGRDNATIAIACILQRAHMIRSPGGYLRTLTDKAETSGFSVEPMLRAVEGKGK